MGTATRDLLIPTAPPVFGFAHTKDLSKVVSGHLKDMPVELADTHVHPSSFNKWCRRREVFRVLKQYLQIGVPRSKNSPSSKKLLEIGNAVHEHYRNTLLSPMLRGYWQCSNCGTMHGSGSDFRPCPTTCESCGIVKLHMLDPVFRFKEVSFVDDLLMLAGSCDGLIEFLGKLRVLEMKTEKEEKWRKRTQPNPGHVLQAVAYGSLMNKHFKVGVTTALIVYVNKTDGNMEKSYLVKITGDAFKWIANEAKVVGLLGKKYAKMVNEAADLFSLAANKEFTEENPLRCKTSTEFVAQSCPACKECFTGHPSKAKKPKK